MFLWDKSLIIDRTKTPNQSSECTKPSCERRMAENEPTSPNARLTSSPKVASPHLRICGTQGVEERPREGFPSESGVARKASKGTSADDGNSGEIAMAKYVASPIFTFSQPVNVKTNQIAEKSARFVALTSFPFSSPHPVDVTFNQIAEKPESIFGTSRGSSSTLPAPPVSPSPSAHSASQAPPTKFAQIPPQWLPRQPFPPSSLPQHLLPPSLRSTTQPASPPPPSLLHFPPPTTYKNSPNLSSSSQSVASSSVPTSGATNVFGGGSTTPSVHHSSKSPLPSSPNIFGCLMQPPPLSLQSRWPPKAKSSQNLFFGQELGILRRKNDNLEKEAKKLRKEKNDLKEDATKWREAKKKLDAEEVSKKAELTRIKQELQLALSKVQIGAIHINNKLTFSSNRGRRQKLISIFFGVSPGGTISSRACQQFLSSSEPVKALIMIF